MKSVSIRPWRWALVSMVGLAVLAVPAALAVSARPRTAPAHAAMHRPELEYLEAVNRAGPPRDPQLAFLLMAAYGNANLSGAGSEFFAARLAEFGPRLNDAQRAMYLAITAVLRAQHAREVPIWRRIGYVEDTIALLSDAKRRSGGEAWVIRWMAGVVSAQLPRVFGQRESAKADLHWCLEHAAQAPDSGWLPEVHHALARIADAEGDAATSRAELALSGYTTLDKPITLVTPYREDAASGHTFASERLLELVPGELYQLSGYEFTEYYFVVSKDRQKLVAIDAGTRPDSARAAYAALRRHAPDLPALTHVLITHSHWDHVGGHTYFGSLEPRPVFHARSNHRAELDRELRSPRSFMPWFFGSRFDMQQVMSFRPDVPIDAARTLDIGGTRFELIPVAGGETEDALLVHLPERGMLFTGDIIMPYLGAPLVEEGSVPGLLQAIDRVVALDPRLLLHGHEPLNRLFRSPAILAGLRAPLAALSDHVLAGVQRGDERAAIHASNLIPPGLLTGDPDLHLPYLVLRANVIDRLYDQHTGYWHADLQGLDALSQADRGALLVDYLGVSEGTLLGAVDEMVAAGRYELAANALEWTRARLGASVARARAEQLVFSKLMEKYQAFDPFKFIVFSSRQARAAEVLYAAER